MLIHAALASVLVAAAASGAAGATAAPDSDALEPAPVASTPAARPAPPPAPPAAGRNAPGRTLWLVQSLYPGQEALVLRTEAALTRLFADGAANREVVGRAQLGALRLDDARVEACLFGDRPCADPVGELVAAYGGEQVVLIKAGQDAGGYRFRVASFQAGLFGAASAEGADAALEQALLGALIKVAPLASSLEIASDPPGATVFVDGERVGVTPLSTQALPGARTLRIELAAHRAIEWKEQVPVRGMLRFERTLEQLPATIVVASEGATILVDGKEAGVGEATAAVAAGKHRVQLVRDGHEPWETTVEVAAGDELRVERKLEATGWHSFSSALAKEQEAIYARGSYVSLSYDSMRLVDDRMAADALKLNSTKTNRVAPDTALWGISAEYGTLGRHLGLMFVGASYFQSAGSFGLGIDNPDQVPAVSPDPQVASVIASTAQLRGGSLRLLHPQVRVAIWRFVIGAQGGFVGRLAHVDSAEQRYRSGFLLADVGVDVQGGLKFFLVDGLYLEGAYQHSFTLAGSTDGMQTFRGGFGYAY